MAKTVRNVIVLVASLLILAGGLFFLFYLEIISPPAIVTRLPIVGSQLSEVQSSAPSKLDMLNEENQSLKKSLTDKKTEMETLQADFSELKSQLEQAAENEQRLKEEIAGLNQEIIQLKTAQSSQKAAYRDMAAYFAAMKAKDAADILARLEDAHIIGIFNEMDKELVAKIMQNLDGERAADITKKMLVATP